MTQLATTLEIVLCHWRDGELKAIERKNGGLERYKTRPSSWADSIELFDAKGADLPPHSKP